MTKTQVDKLGERLRQSAVSDQDLRLLNEYRESFADVYAHVIATIRQGLGIEPTGRRTKSTQSIVEKLHRESVRLSQIQDIAGCRLVVDDIAAQTQAVASLSNAFADATIIDRRQKPSHGYRAVHIIVKSGNKVAEVQVRTTLQHLWAQLSEKLADSGDHSIKYGGGPEPVRTWLLDISNFIAKLETMDEELSMSIMNEAADISAIRLKTRDELRRIQREYADFLAAEIGRIVGKDTSP